MADYVVDTNVLLVGSARLEEDGKAFLDHPVQDDEDAVQQVHDWLTRFHGSDDRIVLDWGHAIFGEYMNKLDDQHFGFRVLMDKYQTAKGVDIELDGDGHAILPHDVAAIVHDLADRKMVAAALAAGGAAEGCEIVNACDTDWYEWESVLADAGLVVRQLIDAWCRARYESRRG